MVENNPRISVIIPVYNAEPYINRCIDSVLAQSFTDFEVLIIDDGSTDRSGEICDEYAVRDARIRVFHKENGGVSAARQLGLDEARGEYAIHTDPDDWCESNMLEDLYKRAKDAEADMVMCDFVYETEYGSYRYDMRPSSLDSVIVLKEILQGRIHGALWSKLIKRSVIKEYNVSFPRGVNYFEDVYVCACLLSRGMVVSYLEESLYHYDCYTNKQSITRGLSRDGFNSRLKMIEMLSEILDQDVYVDEMCTLKKKLKRAAYANGHIRSERFSDLYPEVNAKLIDWHNKGDFILNLSMQAAIDANCRISRVLLQLHLKKEAMIRLLRKGQNSLKKVMN